MQIPITPERLKAVLDILPVPHSAYIRCFNQLDPKTVKAEFERVAAKVAEAYQAYALFEPKKDFLAKIYEDSYRIKQRMVVLTAARPQPVTSSAEKELARLRAQKRFDIDRIKWDNPVAMGLTPYSLEVMWDGAVPEVVGKLEKILAKLPREGNIKFTLGSTGDVILV